MASPGAPYTTKALSTSTLQDFERLFETHPAPGAFPCWCLYNHSPCRPPQSGIQGHAEARRRRRQLVEAGQSHGVLVYAGGRPVGWCQYGRSEELPRIDCHPSYRRLPVGGGTKLWRITCFVVDRGHRRRGVATAALRAALDAIRRQGGGIVEAYPVVRWGAYTRYRGLWSMFERAGFERVARLGPSNFVVRRSVRGV